jgi:hypothetical protein
LVRSWKDDDVAKETTISLYADSSNVAADSSVRCTFEAPHGLATFETHAEAPDAPAWIVGWARMDDATSIRVKAAIFSPLDA